jgi:DNA-binding IscR family transcriptional regulator
VLLHMDEMDQVVTSEALAPLMKANPVVLRRTLAGLRDAGIVRSEKGHGGGWSLARDLGSVTLGDVYAALGTTTLFTIGHRNERPRCLLEQAVNRSIDETLTRAERLLVARLRSITVADVLADASRKSRRSRKESKVHA